MISPTVGRVVLYRAAKDEPEQAAIVTRVHHDRLVNLTVFGHDGKPAPMTSVALVQPEDEPPANAGYCEWMPFQKGQAAKTEALEAKLGSAS